MPNLPIAWTWTSIFLTAITGSPRLARPSPDTPFQGPVKKNPYSYAFQSSHRDLICLTIRTLLIRSYQRLRENTGRIQGHITYFAFFYPASVKPLNKLVLCPPDFTLIILYPVL